MDVMDKFYYSKFGENDANDMNNILLDVVELQNNEIISDMWLEIKLDSFKLCGLIDDQSFVDEFYISIGTGDKQHISLNFLTNKILTSNKPECICDIDNLLTFPLIFPKLYVIRSIKWICIGELGRTDYAHKYPFVFRLKYTKTKFCVEHKLNKYDRYKYTYFIIVLVDVFPKLMNDTMEDFDIANIDNVGKLLTLNKICHDGYHCISANIVFNSEYNLMTSYKELQIICHKKHLV